MNRKNMFPIKKGRTNEQKAILYALIPILFWSTVATAFKIGLRELLPEQLIFIASVTTLFVLLGFLFYTRKFKQVFLLKKRTYFLSAILGFLNPFLYYIILLKSYSLLPAQVAQPINMIWPIVLVLLSVPLLKQKIGWKHLLALLISFSGVYIISSQGDIFSLQKSNPTGIVLGIISAFIWSLYWIFNVKSKDDELVKLFLNFVFGTLFLCIYLASKGSHHFEINQSFYAGIYIGLFEIGFSFIFWIKALSLTTHNARISNLIYIAPFISLLFIHFILKEPIFITTIVGIFFIISGILFQQSSRHRKNEKIQTK